MTTTVDRAAVRWADACRAWELPEALLVTAGTDPYADDVLDSFVDARRARGRTDPADTAALGALPRGGSVLDVGCGAGARSVRLAGRAARATCVDEQASTLSYYREEIQRSRHMLFGIAGTEVRTIAGSWPDVAPEVDIADVVVTGGALYSMTTDVVEFVDQLTQHARRRVVMALPVEHPRAWLSPYFLELHGLELPEAPRAELMLEVLRDIGLRPTVKTWDEPHSSSHGEELVHSLARRCCVAQGDIAAVRDALWRRPPPSVRAMVALSWPGTA